jgi:hypothetical protein
MQSLVESLTRQNPGRIAFGRDIRALLSELSGISQGQDGTLVPVS